MEFHRPAGFDKNISNLKHRRIVDIGHLITEARKLEGHECHKNPHNGYLSFQEEIRHGLQSDLYFKCDSCGEEKKISTVEGKPKEINVAAVSAMYAVGKGHHHLQEIATFLSVPPPAYRTYQAMEEIMGEVRNHTANEAKRNHHQSGFPDSDISVNLNERGDLGQKEEGLAGMSVTVKV